MSSACFIVQPFYKRSAQKGQSKQHCVCIKEKQNNSSQSFLRNPSTLKLPLAHVCALHSKVVLFVQVLNEITLKKWRKHVVVSENPTTIFIFTVTYYFGSAENCESLCKGQNLICDGEHMGQLKDSECLAIHRQSTYQEVDSAKTKFPLNTPAASAKVTSFEVKSLVDVAVSIALTF